MGLLMSIVIGIAADWIAEQMMKRNHGLFTNLIVGAIGGLIGGLLIGFAGLGDPKRSGRVFCRPRSVPSCFSGSSGACASAADIPPLVAGISIAVCRKTPSIGPRR